ncbi:MAG: chemotaxis protein CheW [Pseudomonadota bacterium]
MDDLLREFLTETAESLSELDADLVELEKNPNDPKLLSGIFRLVHTIKGTCGFLGLPRLERVAHASEDVFGQFREGKLEVTAEAVTLIFESLDMIKELLMTLEGTGAEPEGDDSDLIRRLHAVMEGGGVHPEKALEETTAVLETESDDDGELAKEFAEDTVEDIHDVSQAAVSLAALPPSAAKQPSIATQNIRVNVALLENLMNIVSELVLTRNQLLQMVRGKSDSEFIVPLQRLNHVTSELQEEVMKTRMQPVGNAWSKLPRIVRDLAMELGKKIELEMIGADTELDRQVLELIKDPLTHMVRNSADHGIEVPKEREKAAKPLTGQIILNAYHEGGHIIIEISDDGRGISVEKIKKKALTNGLATQAELDAKTDQQILQYIFQPGFSTAEAVTNISGRGVGLDVVRTNIERINGTIEMRAKEGKGTAFTIKIPLTLAIVSALIVECRGERFAIPQISVLELVRSSAGSEHRIERIHETPVLRLRDRLLPLVMLGDLLNPGVQNASENKEIPSVDKDIHKREGKERFVIITQVGTYKFGIAVDRVFDTEEIVVKPVAPILRDIGMFSGNTILGDGSVVMILDPNGIASAAGDSRIGDAPEAENNAAVETIRNEERMSLLLFRAGGEEPKAVPLELVARLEEIGCDKIEYSNGMPMVQYREQLMLLVPLSGMLENERSGHRPVLVFSDRNRTIGLVVDEILDIVESHLKIEHVGTHKGTLGSAIIAGKATDILDVAYYLTQACGNWFASGEDASYDNTATPRRLLLVDDSPFFRNLLMPLLSVSGYQVTSVASADEALRLRETGAAFDAILSDIEMPGMNGFEFAKAVQNDGLWQNTPLVALSSHTSQRDVERGKAAGFSNYVAKSDRDTLLHTLAQTLDTTRGAA